MASKKTKAMLWHGAGILLGAAVAVAVVVFTDVKARLGLMHIPGGPEAGNTVNFKGV